MHKTLSLRFATPLAVIAGAFLAAGILNGCSKGNEYVEPPPPPVKVAKPVEQPVTDYLEFTGTTDAVASIEVRARVRGFLDSMHFTPGTVVEEGDLLFVIEPQEYEAELSAAEAELASAQAQKQRAEIELQRARKLLKERAGSEANVVNWTGERDIANAAILRAEAKVQQAQLNLDYTRVISPIRGRVSRNLVDPGNLVGEGEPTLLTTVTEYSPMYAYFNLNERDLLLAMSLYREKIRKKGIDPESTTVEEADIPLFLGLADEEGFPHEGELDYADSSVDPDTGTLQLRGIFPNKKTPPELLPGLFARLRMPLRERESAILVSERAIGADQSGQYLLIVGEGNVVEKRNVETGQVIDGLMVIEEGLAPNDLIVVNGLQRARPGGKVNPETVDMASLSTSAQRAKAEKAKAD